MTVALEPVVARPQTPLQRVWSDFAASGLALLGLGLVVVLLLLAVFADVVSPHPPNEQYREFTLTPPM